MIEKEGECVMTLRDKELNSTKHFIKRIRLAIVPSIVVLVILWLVHLMNISAIFNFNFYKLGIYPLRTSGLIGIICSPLIHSSFSHLISNSIALLILLTLLFYFYSEIAFKSMFFIWIISGFLTWIIGRSSFHIGASGLVFGLIFFLFFSGILRRHIPLAAVSMIVAFVYGSTIWSVLPLTAYIDITLSWEAHLSGAIAGFVVAFSFRKEGPQKPEINWDEDENEEIDSDDIGLIHFNDLSADNQTENINAENATDSNISGE